MTSLPARLLSLASFALVVAANLAAVATVNAEPAIIAKARATLGTEAALNAVKSVHFSGTVVTSDATAPTKQASAMIEIYFQKSEQSAIHAEQQHIQATSAKTIEITALDGYDAWQGVRDTSDATKWRQTLLGADQIKRLRTNTWESLGFYRGIERHGGRIEEQGTVNVDGATCAKLAFIYAPNIIFYRFIDTATGRLVYTETEAGGTLREQGEIIASGIRFPKTIVTTTKNSAGQIQTVTLTFDKITVNEAMPASLFAVPGLKVK